MLAVWLGIIAGIMHVAAFLLYNKQMLAGQSKPNTTTWTTWVFLSSMNCITYLDMSKDVVKTLLPIFSALACIGTFVFSLLRGKLSKLNFWEYIALATGLFSTFMWYLYHNSTIGNLLLQIPIIISFLPTYSGIWKADTEKSLPWFVWSGAYILVIITIILRWRGQYQDFAYPVNCLILHGGVGILSLRKK